MSDHPPDETPWPPPKPRDARAAAEPCPRRRAEMVDVDEEARKLREVEPSTGVPTWNPPDGLLLILALTSGVAIGRLPELPIESFPLVAVILGAFLWGFLTRTRRAR